MKLIVLDFQKDITYVYTKLDIKFDDSQTEEVLYDLRNRIIEQTKTFLPYITINSVNFRQDRIDTNGLSLEPSLTSNYLHVVIDFTIDSEFTSETLIINL